MQEKAAFKYQDIYLTQTNGRKPDKQPEAEAWSEDGPSSSSDSEEDNRQSNFYDSRSHSSSPHVDHGYSSQGLQQATHGFSQLQIPAGEHPLSTPNPTEPPIEAEHENEEEDEPPDLSGTVRLLSRHPVFSGTYSSVYEGVWEHCHVAVKVIRAVGSLKATRRKYRREAQVWSRLSHPNILPLYGLCMDSDFGPFGALISPWCKNGNSAESVHEIRSPADRIRLLLGVANGVRYLHEHVDILVHGDLKPANILIDDDGVARLCDFGLVRLIQETPSGMTTTTAHTGTVRYLAQELVISDDPKPTTETDCHALGCIALEVRALPFHPLGIRQLTVSFYWFRTFSLHFFKQVCLLASSICSSRLNRSGGPILYGYFEGSATFTSS
ncbi:hypothetical protein FRC16_007745 [Serendipita sp. 398]|nr:hypothetical protein FRC16_007745 [Serendipita sp. 398]